MDTKTLVSLQKDKAHRFLQEADDMLQQQRWDLAANRYYYACYHIVHAIFISNGIIVKTHDGTLTELGRHFILTDKFDKKFGRFFARMIQLRIKADYNSIAEVSDVEVQEMAPLSHEFVENIEKILPY